MTIRRTAVIVGVLLICPPGGAEADPSGHLQSPPFAVELIENRQRLDNDGRGSSTVLTRVRILSEEGREAYGRLYFPYVDGVSKAQVNRVRTIKSDGRKVDASLKDLQEITPSPTPGAPTFGNLRFKVLQLPGLEVGDRVESEVETTLNKPIVPGHFWMSHTPTRDYSVDEERVFLELPAKREVVLEIDKSLPFDIDRRHGRRVYSWSLTNPEAQQGEILRRRLYTVSSLHSWSEVGGWYHEIFRERARLTPELRAFAETLTAGRETPREKLQAIYDHVSMSVRYVAARLGLGGYRPQFAEKTQRDLYGDCKDKHNLLSVLAEAAGLTVYPAFVNTEHDLEIDVPSPVEFDHVISVVDLGDEWLWLDSTPGLTRMGYLPPAWRGRRALVVLDERESRMMEVPRISPVEERNRVAFKGRIDDTGSLSGVLSYESCGTAEAGWRSVAQQGNANRLEWMLRIGRPVELWDVEATAPVHSDPLDMSDTFTMEYSLTKQGFVDVLAGSSRVAIPAIGTGHLEWAHADEPPASDGEDEAEPIVIGGPATIETAFEIELTPTLEVHPPEPVVFERDFARYETEVELRDRTLILHRRLEIRAWELPAERGHELRSFGASLVGDRDRELLIRRVHEVAPGR